MTPRSVAIQNKESCLIHVQEQERKTFIRSKANQRKELKKSSRTKQLSFEDFVTILKMKKKLTFNNLQKVKGHLI